ncbi:MAG: hypothetical protein GVY19_07665 [Bacteroidetes bacterium]|jgi:hypothetical protein|nr:hypothetical protein [Bacteroidota bacterium]
MSLKDYTNIQQNLLQLINDCLPANHSLVDTLSDLLQISTDSAYRRLRGETMLNIREVAAICHHFNLSFDSIASNTTVDTVSFRYRPLSSAADYKIYLQQIVEDTNRLAASGKARLIYAAEDIPLFHHYRIPDLASFKIFYWLRSIINDEDYRTKPFKPGVVPDEFIELGKEAYNAYSRIPGIEIWTNVTAASLILQIKYFWGSGIFADKELALYICDLAIQEINFIEQQAALSKKLDLEGNVTRPETEFLLYFSDVEIGNNTILASIEETKWLYLTHNTLNKMVTANAAFCDETERWLNYLMQKSTLLSGVAEKQRYQFFRNITKQIEAIKEEIEKE